MTKERRFWRDARGSSFESMALALSVIAVMFVAGADLLHYAAKKDGPLARIFEGRGTDVAARVTPPTQYGVDYTPTGSIIGIRRAPALDPCTGATKP